TACVTLNGIVWRSVACGPCLPLIVSGGDKRIPFALKTVRLIVGRVIGSYEATSGASGASANRLGVHGILDPVRSTNVYVADPGLAAVRADFNMNVTFRRIV